MARSSISVRQKLMRIIILISMATLLVASLFFTAFQIQQMRSTMVDDTKTLARVIGNNTQVALAFNIAADAENILNDLEGNPAIDQVAIYNADGELFASYRNEITSKVNFPVIKDVEFYEFNEKQLILQDSIKDATGKLGTIYIASNTHNLDNQIMQNLWVTVLVILVSMLICYLLTAVLQKGISTPIHSLSRITDQIRTSQDYTIRVDYNDYEEVEHLCKGFNSMLEQIEERDKSLQELASFDPLTKLPNRIHFIDLLTKAVKRGKRKSHRHAILFLDLDRFKNINDSMGHSAGDKLLVDVAKRMLIIVRSEDTVARLGGDEYVLLLQEIANSREPADIAKRILEVMNEPFWVNGHLVVITPSIGIVIFPDHGDTPETLVKNADTAMYQAKHAGGNGFRFFSEEMNEMVEKRQQLEEALHSAFRNDEIILHYQPQLKVPEMEIIGLEALSRWQRNGELIPPMEFVPVAEETGLIIPMTDIVMRKAANMIKHWIDMGIYHNRVAINVASRQFKQTNIVSTFKDILKDIDLPYDHIELEITEAAIMEQTNRSIDTLHMLKDLGITVAVDDFGTGYSSLNYLKKFPIDKLKIDKSFIADMTESDKNKNIVNSIIELGHNLDLKIVAEGVENIEQVNMLVEMGCDILQGYYFSRPMPANHIERMLKQKGSLHNDDYFSKNETKH